MKKVFGIPFLLIAPFVLSAMLHMRFMDEYIITNTMVMPPVPVPLPVHNVTERICILVPVTSRNNENWRQLEDSVLYKALFASLKDTCEPEQFLYSIYIGYDMDDAFYNNYTTRWSMQQWMATHMPFMKLVAKPFVNPLQKPGPVMNFLSRTAYNDSCDFMYQVKDTTECLTPWSGAFVRALRTMSPPLHGVVGPSVLYGNTAILTHDFVHRGHLDLFQTHYPPELADWWSDDWITAVYGEQNTHRLKNVVVTRSLVAGIRYKINWSAAAGLRELIAQGRMVASV